MSVYLLALHLATAPYTAPYTAPPHIGVPTIRQSRIVAPAPRVVHTERGVASVWDTPASRSKYGEVTAWDDGYRYHGYGLVCAHRSAPKGAYLRVTCLATGLTVVVRVRDRGPWIDGRVIDMTPGAARAIGLPGHGHQRLGRVVVEHLR